MLINLILIVNLILQGSSGIIKDDAEIEHQFIKGMPVGVKQNWHDAFHYSIEAEPFYKKICIVFKDKSDFPARATLIKIDNSNNYSMTSLSFQYCSDSTTLNQKLIIKTEQEDELEPLGIQINTINKSISHSWGNHINGVPKIAREYPLKVGRKFPELIVYTKLDSIDISEIKDKIIVINWWATTCLPCIAEIPGLNTLVFKYKNKNVQFIALAYDNNNLVKFLTKNQFNYEHYIGASNIPQILGETFPRNIVIDRNGTVRYNELGGSEDTFKAIDKIIMQIM